MKENEKETVEMILLKNVFVSPILLDRHYKSMTILFVKLFLSSDILRNTSTYVMRLKSNAR